MDPGDLFYQVALPDNAGFDIRAGRGTCGFQCLAVDPAGEAQPFKDLGRFFQRYFLTQDVGDIFRRDAVDGIGIWLSVFVKHAPHHLAAAPFPHALQAEAQRGFCQRRMHLAAEAVRCLAAEAGFGEGFAQVDEVPVRRFNQQIARPGMHSGFAAAHHACDGKRSGGIGHEFDLGVKFRLRAVQQDDFLAFGGSAGDDGRFAARPLAQKVIIKSVQRLTGLEHGVVRRVHQGIDRAHASHREPPPHPVWAPAGLGSFHHSQHEARVQLRVADFQPDLFRDGSAFFQGDALRQAQRSARHR